MLFLRNAFRNLKENKVAIEFAVEGQLGIVTLNRPQALHALTLEMITALTAQLITWQEDTAIGAVVIQAVPGKAFCAGGDVRWIYQQRGHLAQQMEFFEQEYALNHLIHHGWRGWRFLTWLTSDCQ
jgi:enoyl-CoA hydratase